MDYTTIKTLRKDKKLTQDDVASMIGISRVTYNLIENGKTPREPYIDSLEDVFDVSFSALDKKKGKNIAYHLDDASYDKAKQLTLYILSKTSQLPNVGKTVLYKILYFCEFGRYELTGERLAGFNFVKLPKGPAPAGFDFFMRRMEKEGAVVQIHAPYMGYTQQRFVINQTIDTPLGGEQKEFVDTIIRKLKDMNAKEVSAYSHGDIPRQTTNDMELIDIGLAHHRHYPYSAKIQQQKKHDDISIITNNPATSFLLHEQDLYEDLV